QSARRHDRVTPGPFRLYLITGGQGHRTRSLESIVEAALRGATPGEVAVQLREKQLDAARLFDLAVSLARVVHAHGGRLFVNDRADVALASGADGVHLTGASIPVHAVKRAYPSLLVGKSTHSLSDVLKAGVEGADFVVAGPVFRTSSKPGLDDVMGVAGLGRICAEAKVPVYALGGMDESNAREAACAGACGVACISAVMKAADPGAAVRKILEGLRSHAA
ncbi:MAG: thiamine phosphate synthase, partial [Myxococcota bacterium]